MLLWRFWYYHVNWCIQVQWQESCGEVGKYYCRDMETIDRLGLRQKFSSPLWWLVAQSWKTDCKVNSNFLVTWRSSNENNSTVPCHVHLGVGNILWVSFLQRKMSQLLEFHLGRILSASLKFPKWQRLGKQ